MDAIIYVYCIVREAPDPGMVERFPDMLLIKAGKFYVVAKQVSPVEFSDEQLKLNLADEAWLDRNAREHLSVIVMVMQQQAVIPFNFGTLFMTGEALAEFVEEYGLKLDASLTALVGREEWAVKAWCDESVLKQNLHLGSKAIADLEKEIAAASPGKAYLLRKKKEEMAEREMSAIHSRHAHAVVDGLRPFAEKLVLNRIASPDVTAPGIRMLINAVFLVETAHIGTFLGVADDLGNQYREVGVSLDVTGPWPPYDFIDISF